MDSFSLRTRSSDPIALQAVRHPDLSTAEAAVREQITAARTLLESVAVAVSPPEVRSGAWSDLGKIYFAYEHFAAAAGCFSNAVLLAPAQPEAWYGLAESELENGATGAAAAAARRFLALTDPAAHPLALAGRRMLGEALERLGDLAAARAEFDQVIQRQPDDLYSLVKLGRIAAQMNDSPGAITALEAAERLAPDRRDVASLLSQEYRKAGRTTDAARAAARLRVSDGMRRTPELRRADPWRGTVQQLNRAATATHAQGLVAMKQGRYQKAAALFETALRSGPDYIPTRVSLGFCRLALGDAMVAGELFLGVLREDSQNELARAGLAQALARTGRADDGLRFCRMWQQEQPSAPLPVQTEAEVLFMKGEFEASAQVYARLAALDPSEVRGPLGQAKALVASGRPQEALRVLQAADSKLEGRTELRHSLARLLAASPDVQARNPARALAITAALTTADASVAVWETHALALAGVGNWRDADEAIQGVLTRLGGDGSPSLKQRLAAVQSSIRSRSQYSEARLFGED